ncbi:2-amino-5-chloromuconate deaminase CnbZ [Lacisediminimonas profundi]|uniref:2-amino-5-chloromuconate deaminase CnbZ n=1 Tax=Lacisediminimonas profundi TaxID=2603856 RepID=UPI00124B6A79|nr:hypothetical protein [Lacisediminimonas profundi]
MSKAISFPAGGYRYLPAVFQYSAGVAAEPGFMLQQARFLRPLPLQAAFRAVEQHLQALGRPMTAFAHCELRSPGQFSDQGFIDFNREYVKTLQEWGLYQPANPPSSSVVNPVARTNVCPEHGGVEQVCMYAFTYTLPTGSAAPASFMLSGGGDARNGSEPYHERIVALGDTSPAGLRLKMAHVLDEMEQRLVELGFGWEDVGRAQAYTVHDIGALVGEMMATRGRMRSGLTWHFARPPVKGLEYEMDLRGAVPEIFLPA